MSDTYTFTIEVFTDALTIVGSYDLPLYRRVSDALNSRLHRFITLRDATVAPIWKPQQGQRVPQILVDVGSALLVATLEEPPPPSNVQAPSLPRDTQPMMFFTTVFAMRADFYKRSDMELVTLLSDMNDDFIPLSNVMIFPLQGGAPISRSFVCLSRLHIQALYAFGSPMAHAPVPASNIDRPAAAPPVNPPPLAPPPPPLEAEVEAAAAEVAPTEQNVTERSDNR
ncbi:MAG: hypothetical protein HC822_28305 [Oscillochloris sp.]|nr:hypothetical protein [Oscillochloris sp.]